MLVTQRLAAYIVSAIQHIPWMLTAGALARRRTLQTSSALPLRTTSARVFLLARPHNSRCEISRLPILDHCCQQWN